MPYDLCDTIVAQASAPGGAARGIVRLAGPRSLACLAPWFQPDGGAVLTSLRRPTMLLGRLALRGIHAPLRCDVYVWPTSRSYTAQPAVEVHTIGSPPLLSCIVRAACLHGARPARAGEFTLRAFLAGRLDLTQAEAVLGVIDARGDRELDVALGQLAGGLGGQLRPLRGSLLDLLAHLEAGLDFVEEDIDFIRRDELLARLADAARSVDAIARQASGRMVTGDAARVVIVGCPNVGKSSLFNALAGEPLAMVSPAAGATRDYLSRRVTIHDLPCDVVDTSGVEPGAARDGIAAAAQQAAAQQRRQAHVELLCLDATRPLAAWQRAELARAPAAGRLIVVTKIDRPRRLPSIAGAIETSSTTAAGLDELRLRIAQAARQQAIGPCELVSATALRCQESLRGAAAALDRARRIAADDAGDELVAAELRAALDELGQVVGAVYTDDILGRVFSRFCIGK